MAQVRPARAKAKQVRQARKQLTLYFDPYVLAEIDRRRGTEPRASYIQRTLRNTWNLRSLAARPNSNGDATDHETFFASRESGRQER